MPANVETIFSVIERPWHGLGKVLDAPPTIDEGIIQAGLDWKVYRKALVTVNEIDQNSYEIDDAETGKYLLKRESDNAVLGECGNDYRIVQNIDAFRWFQPFLDTEKVHLETAGSLNGGETIFVMAKFTGGDSEIVEGDTIEPFILLTNSHNTGKSLKAMLTPVRVVCQNTLSMAIGGAEKSLTSRLVRLSHNQKVHIRLEEHSLKIQEALGLFDRTNEVFRQMAKVQVPTEKALKDYVTQTLAGESELKQSRLKDRLDKSAELSKQEAKVVSLFESGMGSDIPGVRGTWWGAYNAMTEYLQYGRRGTQDERFKSLWMGEHRRVAERALRNAISLSRAA